MRSARYRVRMRHAPLLILGAAVAVAAALVSVAMGATIRGTAKADVIRGTARADVIYGLAGNDRLYGYAGNDRFYPGAGVDTVSCGKGVDRVFADAKDRVAADCEIVTRPSAPNPTPRPPLPGTTRANPIPLGSEVALGDGWRLKVLSSTPDATAAVLDENQFNDPPKAGEQFFMARVSATFTGAGSGRFEGSYRLRAVGAAAVSYSEFENSCGEIPDELTESEVFTGGTITGNVCWSIRSTDAASLVLYDDPIQTAPMRLFFALH